MHETCPACGFKFEGSSGQEGFYLRSTSLNFGVTLTCWLLPIVGLAYTGVISLSLAQGLAFGGAVLPVILYRPSRSWALLNYYIFSRKNCRQTRGRESASPARTKDL